MSEFPRWAIRPDYPDLGGFDGFGEDLFDPRRHQGRDMLCLGGPKHGETVHITGSWMTMSKLEPWPNETEEVLGVLAGHPQPRSYGKYIPREFVDGDGRSYWVLSWDGWKYGYPRL